MAFVGKVGHRAALSDRTDGQEHREPVLEHPEPVQELSKQRFKVGMQTTKSLVTENFSHHTSYLKSCSFIRFFCDTVMNFFSYFSLFVVFMVFKCSWSSQSMFSSNPTIRFSFGPSHHLVFSRKACWLKLFNRTTTQSDTSLVNW